MRRPIIAAVLAFSLLVVGCGESRWSQTEPRQGMTAAELDALYAAEPKEIQTLENGDTVRVYHHWEYTFGSGLAHGNDVWRVTMHDGKAIGWSGKPAR